MSINTHNYEEFLLLYVDDELTTQQREAVERFVITNPDIAEELERLKQTKLLPEQLVFADKQDLLRFEEAGIHMNNYEEYFLLYIDNELTEKEKRGVQNFITHHPQLKEQFALLQQTVLQPEKIEFKNKELLYRTEKEERRVVKFNWVRVAVAAAVAGIIAVILWMMPGANTNNVAINNTPAKNTNKTGDTTATAAQPRTQIKKSEQAIASVKQTENKNRAEKVPVALYIKKQAPAKDNIALNKKQQPLNNQPIAPENKIVIKPDVVIAKVEPPVNKKETIALKPLEETSAENIKNTEATYATDIRSALTQPALYKELDTNEGDSRTLYVGSMQINKDKVRGLFKKASRVFGSKTKDIDNEGDGKLQVANFEVDTHKLK